MPAHEHPPPPPPPGSSRAVILAYVKDVEAGNHTDKAKLEAIKEAVK